MTVDEPFRTVLDETDTFMISSLYTLRSGQSKLVKRYHAEYYYVPHSSPVNYPVYLQYSSCKHVFLIRVENCVYPDQVALS